MNLEKIITIVKGIFTMLAPQLKKADSKEGVKELSEAVDGSLALGVVLAERLKDGVGMDDLGALWDTWKNDEVIKAKLEAAVEGYKKIGVEVKDLDAGEGIEVAGLMLDYVPKYVDALKKDESAA